MSAAAFVVREKDGSGRVTGVYSGGVQLANGHTSESRSLQPSSNKKRPRRTWNDFLSDVFLPEGYPATVSDGEYQIWNSLQAFCSSLASLFGSRAVLQAHGVGNASASATNAILLTVLQDVFSRLTTIVAGYYLGTSLSPEAKTYRLLADVLNDAAIVFDTLSPHLAALALSPAPPFVHASAHTTSRLRIAALCASGACRALCGAVAGGSKAALTVHFASAGARPGDVGDLNAKDGSKETVLALLGMLCGTVVVQYVHSARATYAVLAALIAAHLAFNVLAVRVIALHTLNRQRAGIAWKAFRASLDKDGTPHSSAPPAVPGPAVVSSAERIFADPTRLLGPARAHCTLGAPFHALFPPGGLSDAQIARVLAAFARDRYVLWPAPAGLGAVVALKEGHAARDHLRAWAHAHEVARRRAGRARLREVVAAREVVERSFGTFVEAARAAGWKVDEGALVGGSPVTMSVEVGEGAAVEDKKRV
ncbi:DUF647-domain-containing protein [Epithele typhae]|uniref:DUF647-domain-containing protein n=1 Tax=Epithele typhae TaxID=378194 RepID=UPI002008C4AE|nr:DUF647-domain-containing protein [Epithele typhae]KAH9930524.1 DUF647-domain-containing protein [Epithele typhae]